MYRALYVIVVAALALATAACGGRAFTGPVEVTRFTGQASSQLGSGTIALRFAQELTNQAARDAFRASIGNELGLIGYTVVGEGAQGSQIAQIETSRGPIETSEPGNPVSVGVGGQTGSFGSGVGVGVGIDLGAREERPRVVSRLSVRISDKSSGQTLWEGRAAQLLSINSPYAPVDASARILARGLFRDFPGGNGETVEISASVLEDESCP